MTGWRHNLALYRNNDGVFAARPHQKVALPVLRGAMVKVGKAAENHDPQPRKIWKRGAQTGAYQRASLQCYSPLNRQLENPA